MREVWACLVEFPNYEVSTYGRLKNWKTNRILRPAGRSQYGHIAHHLWRNGQYYPRYIHRLVAATFIDPNIKGFEIDHLDNDPTNNHIWNLEIVTPKINIQRSFNRDQRPSYHIKPVRIVETGEEFRSVTECARFLNRYQATVSYALKHGSRTAGVHIEEVL